MSDQERSTNAEQTRSVQDKISNLSLGGQPRSHISPYGAPNGVNPTKWKDITSFLEEACSELDIGQLLHLESFTLYDAMSAIEIMDPKMDTGMLLDTENNKKTFDHTVRLNPEEVLWIIDRLVVCEMTWLTGQSLAQTIYTCLYVHRIFSLDFRTVAASATATSESTTADPLPQAELVYIVLRSYILGTIKCLLFVWREMIKGNFYEEEDFTTNLFGLNLHEQFPESNVLTELEAAEEFLDAHHQDPVMAHLLLRVRVRRLNLMALMHMSQPNCAQYSEARRLIKQWLEFIGPQGNVIKDSNKCGVEVAGAFDPNINRKLSAQTPPRPITFLTMNEALDSQIRLMQQLESICEIVNYINAETILNFFTAIAAQRPYPCAFVRSKLNSTFYSEHRILGNIPVSYLVRDAIIGLSAPPLWWFGISEPKPSERILEPQRQKVRTMVGRFVERAARPFTDYFKILCHNRARQRRIMQKFLNDWENLQDEAEQLDAELHNLSNIIPIIIANDPVNSEPVYPYHLSSWVFHRKLVMMEQILLLGFELELYGEHEYEMMYWYLDYILQCHYQHFERVCGWSNNTKNRERAEEIATLEAPRSKKTGKKSKGSSSSPSSSSVTSTPEPQLNSTVPIIHLEILTFARQELCRGLYRAILGVRKTGHLRFPRLEYDDERTRFQHRFRHFNSCVSPSYLRYEEYLETGNVDDVSASDLLTFAHQSFQDAKVALESLISISAERTNTEHSYEAFKSEIQAMMKTCIANSVACQVVLRETKEALEGKQLSPRKSVKMEFRYHCWWPVLALV